VQQTKARNGSTGGASNRAMNVAAKPRMIRTPMGWQEQRPGPFLLHVDESRESPVAFALSVAAGLDDEARWLDSRYLYDAAGSELFERITAQPEYYQTRTEERLLAQHARHIRALVGDVTLVELGSGSSSKTRHLLDAWVAAGKSRYVPIDVSAAALEQACAALASRYPCLSLEGIAASYERGLPVLAGGAPMLLAFLGSSLGNLGRHQQGEFLDFIAAQLAPGDFFLVGLDLVQDPGVLEASYNDAAGVTADFTRNLFVRMNRELGTDIPIDAVEHVAFYNGDRERIEIYAEFRRELNLRIDAIDRQFRVARGERIRTELSHKYRPEAVATMMGRHGFELVHRAESGVDDGGQHGFGLYLFRRKPHALSTTLVGGPAQHWRAGLGELDRVRARTLDLVAPLSDRDLTTQHSRLMSPLVWDMGHIAHFESLWLVRKLESDGGHAPSPPGSLDEVYDPQSTPRKDRDRLPLPTPAEARGYMADVRAQARARIAALDPAAPRAQGPLLAQGQVLHLVVQHEAQHQETMLQAIALRDDLPYRPSFVATSPAVPAMEPPTGSVLIPAGPFVMGTNDEIWAYDNERPAHQVDVAAFRMATTPVSNGDYLAFMADGGYTRRALWSKQGWAWRQSTGAVAPEHWRRDRGAPGAWRAVVFGQPSPLDPVCPVVHVSWYEADAFARWAGKRLPTEAEWEKAAAWDEARQISRRWPWGDGPASGGGGEGAEARVQAFANLGQRRLGPAPAGAYAAGRSPYGCLQMVGDVWEWTSTWFDGYPGFRSFPYREYSEIFFGNSYRVLRGGSFATDVTVARNTFRNWDYPERRQIFAGFRLAEDV
jgi:iron(II)-dependent oxidoreductase